MASDTPTPFDAAIIEMEHALATKVKNRHVLSDYDDGNIGGTNHCLAILHRHRDAWLASRVDGTVASVRPTAEQVDWELVKRYAPPASEHIEPPKSDWKVADAEKEQGRNG